MRGMYEDQRRNLAILAAAGVFGGALWLVRSHQTVGKVAYIKAMIPHRLIAIMTSERAHVRDLQVRKIADGIIGAQVRETVEMKCHVARLEAAHGRAGPPVLPGARRRAAAAAIRRERRDRHREDSPLK